MAKAGFPVKAEFLLGPKTLQGRIRPAALRRVGDCAEILYIGGKAQLSPRGILGKYS